MTIRTLLALVLQRLQVLTLLVAECETELRTQREMLEEDEGGKLINGVLQATMPTMEVTGGISLSGHSRCKP